MAAVVNFDRRATHRVISEPVALEMAMDVDALAQEAITYLEPAHLLALGKRDNDLVRALVVAHAKVKQIRETVHAGVALLEDSYVVDPYHAVSPDAA